MVRVDEDSFGEVENPWTKTMDKVRRFTISNKQMSVQVITLGATITSIKVPDANGVVDEINMGFDTVEDYVTYAAAYVGVTIGPTCNRMGNASFILNGEEIKLTQNHLGKHHLHGGLVGYSFAIWEVDQVIESGVVMKISSPENYEGYPGKITAFLTFSLTTDNCLQLQYEVESTKTTVINMTNHAYFNLAGHGAGKNALYAHNVQILAEEAVEVDEEQVPTGSIAPLKGTPYDFLCMTNLGKRIKTLNRCPIKGIDKNYCLRNTPNSVVIQAKVCYPPTGRWLEVSSDQPSMVFYTSNNLPDEADCNATPVIGHNGVHYCRHGAFCMETQKYPDGPRHENFPSIIINPGDVYKHNVHYRFGTNRVR